MPWDGRKIKQKHFDHAGKLQYDETVPNDLLFCMSVLIELLFVLCMLRLGKQGLVGVIVVNIVLVTSFGALLLPLFGITTNAGNVFYGAIFLTAQVMAECYGRKAAFTSVWVGFSALVLFILMAQYTIRLVPAAGSAALASSMHTVFTAAPRIAVASMSAYLVSQNVNVWLFTTLQQKTHKRKLWLRALASAIVGQLVDSALFFSIAFLGTVPGREVVQTMAVGFGAKLLVALAGLPVLYVCGSVARLAGDARTRQGEG